MTPRAIPVLEEALGNEDIPPPARLRVLRKMDEALGLRLGDLSRKDLRVRPADARLQGPDVEARVEARRKARAEKNFLEADRIRAELENAGVDVKDGDPLAWEWRIETPE
jgi:cysteinyl-tRNA synthetase